MAPAITTRARTQHRADIDFMSFPPSNLLSSHSWLRYRISVNPLRTDEPSVDFFVVTVTSGPLGPTCPTTGKLLAVRVSQMNALSARMLMGGPPKSIWYRPSATRSTLNPHPFVMAPVTLL